LSFGGSIEGGTLTPSKKVIARRAQPEEAILSLGEKLEKVFFIPVRNGPVTTKNGNNDK